MKNWQSWVIVAIILIQSFYLSMKFKSIEQQEADLQRYVKNIDKNVATVDERLVWKVIPKVEDTESNISDIKAIMDYLY